MIEQEPQPLSTSASIPVEEVKHDHAQKRDYFDTGRKFLEIPNLNGSFKPRAMAQIKHLELEELFKVYCEEVCSSPVQMRHTVMMYTFLRHLRDLRYDTSDKTEKIVSLVTLSQDSGLMRDVPVVFYMSVMRYLIELPKTKGVSGDKWIDIHDTARIEAVYEKLFVVPRVIFKSETVSRFDVYSRISYNLKHLFVSKTCKILLRDAIRFHTTLDETTDRMTELEALGIFSPIGLDYFDQDDESNLTELLRMLNDVGNTISVPKPYKPFGDFESQNWPSFQNQGLNDFLNNMSTMAENGKDVSQNLKSLVDMIGPKIDSLTDKVEAIVDRADEKMDAVDEQMNRLSNNLKPDVILRTAASGFKQRVYELFGQVWEKLCSFVDFLLNSGRILLPVVILLTATYFKEFLMDTHWIVKWVVGGIVVACTALIGVEAVTILRRMLLSMFDKADEQANATGGPAWVDEPLFEPVPYSTPGHPNWYQTPGGTFEKYYPGLKDFLVSCDHYDVFNPLKKKELELSYSPDEVEKYCLDLRGLLKKYPEKSPSWECVDFAKLMVIAEYPNTLRFFTEEYKDQFLALEDTVELTACAYLAMGLDVTKKKDVVDALRAFPQMKAGAAAVTQALINFVVKASDWVSRRFGVEVSLAESLDERYRAWYARAKKIIVDENYLSLDISRQGLSTLEDMINDGRALAVEYSNVIKDKTLTALMHHHLKILEKVYTQAMTLCRRFNSNRVEPACVLLQGDPGTGKTTAAKTLAALHCMRMFKNDPERLRRFEENPDAFIGMRSTDKFFEGFSPEMEVYIHDDIGNYTPDTLENSRWIEMQNEINVIAHPLKMAGVEQKGNMFYNQSLTIITTNEKGVNDPFLTEVGAVQRRLHHIYRVTNKGITLAEAQLSEITMDRYVFTCMKPTSRLVNGHIKYSKTWEVVNQEATFEQVFAAVEGTYEMHRQFHNASAQAIQQLTTDVLERAEAQMIPGDIVTQLANSAGIDRNTASIMLMNDAKLLKKTTEELPKKKEPEDKKEPIPGEFVGQMDSFAHSVDPVRAARRDEILKGNMDVVTFPDVQGNVEVQGFDVFGLGFRLGLSDAIGNPQETALVDDWLFANSIRQESNKKGFSETIDALLNVNRTFTVYGHSINVVARWRLAFCIGVHYCCPWETNKDFEHLRRVIIPLPRLSFFTTNSYQASISAPLRDAEGRQMLDENAVKAIAIDWSVSSNRTFNRVLTFLLRRVPTDMFGITFPALMTNDLFNEEDLIEALYFKGVRQGIDEATTYVYQSFLKSFRLVYSAAENIVGKGLGEFVRALSSKIWTSMGVHVMLAGIQVAVTAYDAAVYFEEHAINPVYAYFQKAKQWVVDNRHIILGVMLAATTAVAAYRLIKGGKEDVVVPPQENQSGGDDHQTKDAKIAQHRAKLKAKQSAKNRERQNVQASSSQMVTAKFSDDLAPHIRKNLVMLVTPVEPVKVVSHVLFIKQRDALFPRHIYMRNAVRNELNYGHEWVLQEISGANTFRVDHSDIKILFDYGSERDLILVRFPGPQVREFTNITKHFATPKEASVVVSNRLTTVGIVSSKTDLIVEASSSVVDTSRNYKGEYATEDGVVYTDSAAHLQEVHVREPNGELEKRVDLITYPLPTKNGACGSVVINGDKIVAIHTNGNTIQGNAARFDLSDLQVGYQSVGEEIYLPAEDGAEAVVPDFLEFSGQGYDMSCHTGVPFGLAQRPTSGFVKRDLVRWKSNTDFPEPTRIPVNTNVSLYAQAREGYKPYEHNVNWDLFDAACETLGAHYVSIPYGGSFRPFSLLEAIKGKPGTSFGAMRTDSSPGFPENTEGLSHAVFFKFSDKGQLIVGPRFNELMRQCLLEQQLLAQDMVPVFPWTDMLKYELRKPEKIDKPRLISASCKTHLILSRAYFGMFMLWLQETVGRNPTLIGFNPGVDWDYMERMFIKFGGEDRHGAGDYSGWDKRIFLDLMLGSLKPLEILAGQWGQFGTPQGKAAARVRRNLAIATVESVHVRGRYMEKWESGFCSGAYITAMMNSNINTLKFIYCFGKICADGVERHSLADSIAMCKNYFKCVFSVFMGDDNRFAVASGYEKFNCVSLAETLKDFGDVYTDPEKSDELRPFIPRTEASIVKRKPVFHEDIGRHLGALDLDVILDMVNYTKKGDEYGVIRDRANSALLELCQHPRSVWEKWYPRILEHVGAHWRPQYPTYDYARDDVLNLVHYLDEHFHLVELNDVKQSTEPRLHATTNQMAAEETPNIAIPPVEVGTFSAEPVDVVDHNPTTHFANDTEGYDAHIVNSVDFNKKFIDSIQTPANQTIIDFLQRPAVLANGIFQTTDVGTVWQTDVTSCVTPLKAARLQGIYTIRSGYEVTLQVNADRFQAGRIILAWIPDGGEVDNVTFTKSYYDNAYRANLQVVTQLPHVELDLAKQTHVTLEIPYTSAYPYNVVRVTGGAAPLQRSMGTIFLYIYSPLLLGTGGSTTCGYTIWGSLKDIELGTVTVNQMADEETKEAKASGVGPVTRVLDKVSRATSILGNLPIIGPYATSVSWVSTILRDTAKVFGWSKPVNLGAPQRVDRKMIPYTANYDQPFSGHTLGVSSENKVIQHTGVSRTNFDEMSIDFIKTRWCYTTTFNWTTSNVYGDVLVTLSPGNESPTAIGKGFTLPPYAMLQQLFRFWRGGVYYRFKLIKTAYQRGRVMIAFAPGTSVGAFTIDQSEYLYRQIVDISTTSEFEVCIPYLIPDPWLKYGTPLGRVQIFVIDPLVAPAVVATTIPFMVEVCAGDDMEYSVPDSWPYTPYSPAVVQSDDTYVQTPCITLGPTSVSKIEVTPMTIGEKIQSTRQLIKRMMTSNAFTVGPGLGITSLVYAYCPTLQKTSNTSPLLKDVTAPDLLTYLQGCYTFTTGSIREYYRVVDANTIGSIAPTFSMETHFPTAPVAQKTTVTSAASVPSIIAWVGLGIEGMIAYQAPVWNPNYARSNWGNMTVNGASITAHSASSNQTSVTVSDPFTSGGSPTNGNWIYSRSAGDDFHMSRWICAVPYVSNSAT